MPAATDPDRPDVPPAGLPPAAVTLRLAPAAEAHGVSTPSMLDMWPVPDPAGAAGAAGAVATSGADAAADTGRAMQPALSAARPDSGLLPADAATAALEQIADRVLWLATRIVDAANHDRDAQDGIKVGGHQASSASMVTLMTALWFGHLRAADKVAVKPHASPVLHAISYLLGDLDADLLPRLRDLGGLQAYPSRTKDHQRLDFSTGSVGLGATAPLFAAAARRYVDAHFGARPASRFIALLGDAELDEGNVWEALLDPVAAGLGNVLWVVDLNRQSLDRVVPGIKVRALEQVFAAAGWHVVAVKYGRQLRAAFERPGGKALRRRIDAMSNDEYQGLFALRGPALRAAVTADDPKVAKALAGYTDDDLPALLGNLGGHDMAALLDAYAAADAVPDRPTVVIAYTVKGFGLPIAGDPLNHSALLTGEQVAAMRAARGLTSATEWDRLPVDTPAGRRVQEVAAALARGPRPAVGPAVPVPAAALDPRAWGRTASTQDGFGRVLQALARTPAAERIVTLSPDVSVSTNLGGWINKVGVFAPAEQPDYLGEDRVLRWRQSPAGQHLELGISEMNLFTLLGQLGLTWDLSEELLLPVGTVYDPFVCRGLDAFIHAAYSGARFVIVGTPSGVTLAPEGGAHQSTVTASLGAELPGVDAVEPAFVAEVDWLLCDGLTRLADLSVPAAPLYLRLSTRPVDQAPFTALLAARGAAAVRADVLAGGYLLADTDAGPDAPQVQLAVTGACVPEALAAAGTLTEEGVSTRLVVVTSLDRLHRGWVARRRGWAAGGPGAVGAAATAPHVAALLRPGVPVVTVHDAASHALSWLGSVHGSRVTPLGVDSFGQSGSIPQLYRTFGLDAESITTAAVWAALGA